MILFKQFYSIVPSLPLLSFRVPSFLHYFWFNNATADAASITLAQTSWKLLANLIRFVHYDTSLLGSYWCIFFPFSLEIQRKMKWNIHDSWYLQGLCYVRLCKNTKLDGMLNSKIFVSLFKRKVLLITLGCLRQYLIFCLGFIKNNQTYCKKHNVGIFILSKNGKIWTKDQQQK